MRTTSLLLLLCVVDAFSTEFKDPFSPDVCSSQDMQSSIQLKLLERLCYFQAHNIPVTIQQSLKKEVDHLQNEVLAGWSPAQAGIGSFLKKVFGFPSGHTKPEIPVATAATTSTSTTSSSAPPSVTTASPAPVTSSNTAVPVRSPSNNGTAVCACDESPVFDPVCDSAGNTHRNPDALQCAVQCRTVTSGVTLARIGPCDSSLVK